MGGTFRATAPSMSNSEIMDIRIRDGDGAALADVAADGPVNALYVQSVSLTASINAVTASVEANTLEVTAAATTVTTALTDGSQITQIEDADGHAWNVLDTGEGDVNLERVNGAEVNIGSGTIGTGTLRVTLATDDPVAAATGVVAAVTPPTRRMTIGVIAETTFPDAVADGQLVNPLHDEYGRQWIKGYDVTSDSLSVTDISPAVMATQEVTFAQLTAPGSTVAVEVSNYHHYTFQVTVAAIDTTVTVRAEGSLDNTVWFNLDDTRTDLVIAANGTYSMRASNRKCKHIRFTFVSEVGGTAATIDVKLMCGN